MKEQRKRADNTDKMNFNKNKMKRKEKKEKEIRHFRNRN